MRFIGCKTLLLEQINNVIEENIDDATTFCDIFSGTATVGRYFKNKYRIISNDLLYFSFVLQRGTIGVNNKNMFLNLREKKQIFNPIDYFNSLSNESMESLPKDKRFCQNNYSPIGNRMYITDDNALRIDFIRREIEEWKNSHIIDDDEYYYLLACLIEGIPYVSNISGTYGAFHKKWDKRAFKKYQLVEMPIENNDADNMCYNCDGVELLKSIDGDILYIDPPYNSRQYLPNYHLLETVARYDNPKLKGVTGQRDYGNERSDFCIKRNVGDAFESLIKNANFKHIILSYSTDGIMEVEFIEKIMKKYGEEDTFKLYKIPYRRYKSRLQQDKEELKELIFYIRKKV